jgi:hypothetical protein
MDAATSVYSCDDHLDMHAVPPELWRSRLSGADAERGPRVVERDGGSVWVCEDRVLGQSGRHPRANTEALKKLSAIGRAGIEDDGYRAGNAKLRLEDLDRDGLQASVIYGPLALGLPIDDPGLQDACYAAWNDWAVEEFNAVAPDRLCVLGFLPGHSPEAAAAELERCAAIGHRGAVIDVFAIDLSDRGWDRLWAAAESTGLPVSFHLKGGSWSGLSYQIGKWQSAAFATILPYQLDEPLATMLFSGALERHPGLTRRLAAIVPRPGRPGMARPSRQPRLRARGRAERVVPPPGVRDLRGGAVSGADPAARRGPVHVGVGLSAHRQHLPRVAEGDRRDARRADCRGAAKDHRDELRRAVRVRGHRLTTRATPSEEAVDAG